MKLKKIVGMKKADFDFLVDGKDFESNDKKEIFLRPARLIPVYKPGDEMALTSIFLSSLCLIKEFKNLFFSEIKLPKSGQLFVYTEFQIKSERESRPDGLLLLVKGGVIKDAVIFEMKNKNEKIKEEQISRYIAFAKKYKISKLVTISNQFVSNPTQSPVPIRVPKSIEMYHFSWSYLLTLARILLFDNDTNIEDPDQVAIMKEVVAYLENKISGVCGFTKMKSGWKEAAEKINSNTSLKQTDHFVHDAVTSWQQEERDMALILSRNLGLMVKTKSARYENLQKRIAADIESLIDKKELVSSLKVDGAVSDILIKALFYNRTIEMSVKLDVPQDKTIRGQVGWIKRELDKCKKKNKDDFDILINDVKIDINLKHVRDIKRISLDEIEEFYLNYKDKVIKDVRIALYKDFGKGFSSTVKFVETIESMLLSYYEVFVQYFQNWDKPAPKIVTVKADSEN